MSRFLAYILFAVLVAQPIAPVFAADEPAAPIPEPVAPLVPQSVTSLSETLPQEPLTSDSLVSQGVPDSTLVSNETTSGDGSPEVLLSTAGDNPLDVSGEVLGLATSSTSIVLDDTNAESDLLAQGSSTPLVPEVSTTTASTSNELSDVLSTPADEISPTTTESLPTEQGPLVLQPIDTSAQNASATPTTTAPVPSVAPVPPTSISYDLSQKSFPKESCVAVGGGTFYCKEDTGAPEVLGTDRVFSAPDEEGDKEIFVERGDALTQVSFNKYDDDAPRYDETSNSLVWHRLIDGVYQIILYDIDAETETQLTHDSYNNMEPSLYGDAITWQAWVGTDWDIMLSESGNVTVLTDNAIQDVAPRVMGDYILWESYENGTWRVKVYDRRTKIIDTIADADGASVDNPRFVLVYDTKYENGDVETKGYDLDTGKVVPLSATPMPTPQDLPDPDQTGEDRALVQPPVNVKTKSATSTDSGGNDGPPTDVNATTTNDVIVTPFVEEMGATTTDATHIETQVTDTATTTLVSVPDLIITPFVESISTTSDSQVQVATST
jgi:hypothetical protein